MDLFVVHSSTTLENLLGFWGSGYERALDCFWSYTSSKVELFGIFFSTRCNGLPVHLAYIAQNRGCYVAFLLQNGDTFFVLFPWGLSETECRGPNCPGIFKKMGGLSIYILTPSLRLACSSGFFGGNRVWSRWLLLQSLLCPRINILSGEIRFHGKSHVFNRCYVL